MTTQADGDDDPSPRIIVVFEGQPLLSSKAGGRHLTKPRPALPMVRQFKRCTRAAMSGANLIL
jgi:hypothetical protein